MKLVRYVARQRLPLTLIVCGFIGLTAAFVLTLDKIRLIADPAATVGCNINPIISCGSVMKTPEASVFGFANSIMGLPAFAVVITIGVLLLSGAVISRWIWTGLLIGSFMGMALVHYLFFQSVYNIGALCPYCMITWIVTAIIFGATLVQIIRQKYFSWIPDRVGGFLIRHRIDIFACWVLTLTGLILHRFWYYFGSVI